MTKDLEMRLPWSNQLDTKSNVKYPEESEGDKVK